MNPTRLIVAVVVGAICLPIVASAQVRVIADVDCVPTADYLNKKDRLDVYVPSNVTDAPVIVSIHGGALRQGDKSKESFVGQRFAAAGYVTVVINYRLSPDVMHPAHTQDAAAAVAWVKRNIGQYGGNSDKLFVIGHSAGAYLAALLVFDPQYLAAHGMTPKDVRGVVPVSGFFYVDRQGVAPDRPKDTWGTDVNVWRAASPAKYVRRDIPPTLLLYADGDEGWRKQQQEDFAKEVRKAGDSTIATRMIGGRTHMSIWSKMAEEEETSQAILQFIARLNAKASASSRPTS